MEMKKNEITERHTWRREDGSRRICADMVRTSGVPFPARTQAQANAVGSGCVPLSSPPRGGADPGAAAAAAPSRAPKASGEGDRGSEGCEAGGE